MKILSFSLKNILGVRQFECTALGKWNWLKGSNGAGKSSVVKGLLEGIKPTRGMGAKMITTGEDQSEITIQFDDDLALRRRSTISGSTDLQVMKGDAVLRSPQAFLDRLIGSGRINPIDLFEADPKERLDILLAALPMQISRGALEASILGYVETLDEVNLDQFDFGKHGLRLLEDIREAVKNSRLEVGRDKDRAKKAGEELRSKMPADAAARIAEFEGFDFEAEMQALEQDRDAIAENDGRRRQIEEMRRLRSEAQAKIADFENQIKALEEKIETGRQVIEDLNGKGQVLVDQVSKFAPPDLEARKRRLSEFDEVRAYRAKSEEIEALRGRQAASGAKYDRLSTLLKVLTTEIPAEIIRTLDSGIEGLWIAGDEILVNGVPLDTLARSEQLKFCVRVARAVAGELKIVFVDGIEELDPMNIKALNQETENDGFQYVVAQVAWDFEKDAKGKIKTDKKGNPYVKPMPLTLEVDPDKEND